MDYDGLVQRREAALMNHGGLECSLLCQIAFIPHSGAQAWSVQFLCRALNKAIYAGMYAQTGGLSWLAYCLWMTGAVMPIPLYVSCLLWVQAGG